MAPVTGRSSTVSSSVTGAKLPSRYGLVAAAIVPPISSLEVLDWNYGTDSGCWQGPLHGTELIRDSRHARRRRARDAARPEDPHRRERRLLLALPAVAALRRGPAPGG